MAEQPGGTIGRGVVEGAARIPETLQGIDPSGIWIDGKLGIRDPQWWTDPTSYPVADKVDQELDRQGAYKPTPVLEEGGRGCRRSGHRRASPGGVTGTVSGAARAGAQQLGASLTLRATFLSNNVCFRVVF